jgi:hypothetical protein
MRWPSIITCLWAAGIQGAVIGKPVALSLYLSTENLLSAAPRAPYVAHQPAGNVTIQPVSSVTNEPVSSVTNEPVSSVTNEPVSIVTSEPVPNVTTEPVGIVTPEPVPNVTTEPVGIVSNAPVANQSEAIEQTLLAAIPDGYWLNDLSGKGRAAFNDNPGAYKVFRNVKEYVLAF